MPACKPFGKSRKKLLVCRSNAEKARMRKASKDEKRGSCLDLGDPDLEDLIMPNCSAISSRARIQFEPTDEVDDAECNNDAAAEHLDTKGNFNMNYCIRVEQTEIKQEPGDDGWAEWSERGGSLTMRSTYTQTNIDTNSDIKCDVCQELVEPVFTPPPFPDATGPGKRILNNVKDEITILTTAHRALEKVKKLLNARRNVDEGRKDTLYKLMIMKFFLTSPSAYRLLYETLNLPSEAELKKTHITTGTVLSEEVVACLRAKVETLSGHEKYCVLSAAEVSLKPNLFYKIDENKIYGLHDVNETQKRALATRALVLLAGGLLARWRQPVAYCLLGPTRRHAELNDWLDAVIAKLMGIGLTVVAFTTNHGTDFVGLAKLKNVSAENPHFRVKGKKIYYFFDVPRLLSSIRNRLTTHDFVHRNVDGTIETASWRDVKDLYEAEQARGYRLAPALTLRGGRRAAAALFARPVAAALARAGAAHTAALVQLLSDAVDVLDSAPAEETRAPRKPFAADSDQIEALERALAYARDVRAVRRTGGGDAAAVTCLKYLAVTIRALLELSNSLKRFDLGPLHTRRLSRGELGALLASLRRRRRPTPVRFVRAFGRHVLAHALAAPARAGPSDLDAFLQSIGRAGDSKNFPKHHRKRCEVILRPTDCELKLPPKNALHFVCEYLLKKCFAVHHASCHVMDSYVFNFNKKSAERVQFKKYVLQIDRIVVKMFRSEDGSLPRRIVNRILEKVEQVRFVGQPCECFPVRYLAKLYVCIRIYNIVKHNNRRLKNDPVPYNLLEIPDLWVLANDIC